MECIRVTLVVRLLDDRAASRPDDSPRGQCLPGANPVQGLEASLHSGRQNMQEEVKELTRIIGRSLPGSQWLRK